MRAADVPRAVAAASSSASALGLNVDNAVVLQDSNRLAVRLLPCDVLARVAYVAHQAGAAFEVEVAQRLAETDSPVAALERLHAGLRQFGVTAPHFTDRVAAAQRLVGNRARTPELTDADRALLDNTLGSLKRKVGDRGAAEQLLHGEPHPGNLLRTQHGLRFIDLETCCHGPVEFDLAHAPDEVGEHYPDADQSLLRKCRMLMLAMIATWRWDRDDQLPNGRQLSVEWLGQLRRALDRDGRILRGDYSRALER